MPTGHPLLKKPQTKQITLETEKGKSQVQYIVSCEVLNFYMSPQKESASGMLKPKSHKPELVKKRVGRPPKIKETQENKELDLVPIKSTILKKPKVLQKLEQVETVSKQ